MNPVGMGNMINHPQSGQALARLAQLRQINISHCHVLPYSGACKHIPRGIDYQGIPPGFSSFTVPATPGGQQGDLILPSLMSEE